jgi:hypothetical protein
MRLQLLRLLGLAVIGLPGFFPGSLHAGLIPINEPDATYLASTTKIDLNSATYPDGASVSSVTDGNLTVTFSSSTTALTVVPGVLQPGTTYPTWGSPPQTESNTPRVLDGGPKSSLTLTLSHSVNTFGLEVQPDAFEVLPITAEFFNGATSLGSIMRQVDGLGDPLNPGPGGGAQLFAASAMPGQVITSVVLTIPLPPFPDEPTGFAFGQIRYEVVPEPTSIVLVLVAGAFWGGHRRFRRAGRNANSLKA